MLKKTKIVATVGPASDKEEILRHMLIFGVFVLRFLFCVGCVVFVFFLFV
ncbi:pyruvate kinase, partial [Campylobacter jejuni]